MSIPLPNQIKVAPKNTPVPEAPAESSTSGTPETKPARKAPREIRPFTQRLGKNSELAEAFEKMGQAAAAAARATDGLKKPHHPKGQAAQAEPVRNKRRTGRRAQRP